MSGNEVLRVDLRHDEAVVTARQRARDVAELVGFAPLEQTRIATAVSELARNAQRYATGGQVRVMAHPDRIEIEVSDNGPGIANLDEILEGRYRSSTGMGRGLTGVRLLMDEFRIDAPPGRGTRVRIAKRLPAGAALHDPRSLRDELTRRGAHSPYDELTRQNEELLQALGEVRARQRELVALNRELEDTNRGVVALYAELDDRAELLRYADDRKSRFLADMSHELRTPLNSICALTELLLDDTNDNLTAEQSKQVAYIGRAASEQLVVVGDLLDIAKIEAGHMQPELADVSVAELFTILRSQLRPLAGSDVSLGFDASPGLPLLCTDEGKLVQILRNLVSNALKFTARGTVTVSAEGDDDGAVLFSVRDTGIGIAPEHLERIFDEFVQIPGELQRGRRGTGLGLPLSRKLAGILNGNLEVRSQTGVGTTFTVRIPIVFETAAAPQADLPDLAGSVLVVDDDEAMRYVLQARLRDGAWPIHVADSGSRALAMMAGSIPVAVILDLSMPDLDGVEVLQRLRDDVRTAQLPVIVHTSRLLDGPQHDRIRALGAHVLDKSHSAQAQLPGLLVELVGGARVR